MMKRASLLWPILVFAWLGALPGLAAASGFSLRFFGTGAGDVDRVKIPLVAPSGASHPLNVGGDFTLEFWLKALPGQNTGSVIAGANDNWINGNIVFDRDVFGAGDLGDFGISLGAGRIAFGVAVGGNRQTILGSIAVDDGAWHHVAVTRRSATGAMAIFVDGVADAQSSSGPAGNIAYRAGRATAFPGSDPYLVIGAEKHDAGSAFPSFHGWLDEVRVSRVVRYAAPFARPASPFAADLSTVALYHFDEGGGDVAFEASVVSGNLPAGAASGTVRRATASGGPAWSPDTPFAAPAGDFELRAYVSGFSAPVDIVAVPGMPKRLAVVEQIGLVRLVDDGVLLARSFLALDSSKVITGGERGLLSIAFHPDYARNGFLYILYTRAGDGALTLARYTRAAGDPDVADPASAVVLQVIPHAQFSNHNGGKLAFGPDGYLYWSTGDGGGGNDPLRNAQNLGSLLGKILRLDVDAAPPYGIPADNPFVGISGVRPEVFAYGLRNPWRTSFDRLTGDLFIGDVGQSQREEIDLLPWASPGGENFGWRVWEGTRCNAGVASPTECAALVQVPPIIDYDRSQGGAGFCGGSVTGGARYRGALIPPLVGRYLFADYCTTRLWYAFPNEAGVWQPVVFGDTTLNILTFGQDADGEILVGTGQGTIYRVVARDTDGDGLPDWWERAFSGSPTALDPLADGDGDGVNNRIEFRYRTHPSDRTSKPARVDFDGDGISDLVWRDSASGQVVAWQIRAGAVVGSIALGGDANWTPLAMGHLRGLPDTDIAWRSGPLVVGWYMDRNRVASSALLCDRLAPGPLGISGAADTAGTGVDAIVVAQTGASGVDRFDGEGLCANRATIAAGLASASVIARGDFDGDSRADFLLRLPSGAVHMWRSAAPTVYTRIGGDMSWSVFGVGDFNGDGKTDIVWRNANDGATVFWLMNSTTPAAQQVLGLVNGWRIAHTADFDGDGRDDLVWQNIGTGAAVIWLMDGVRQTSSLPLSGATSWQVLSF